LQGFKDTAPVQVRDFRVELPRQKKRCRRHKVKSGGLPGHLWPGHQSENRPILAEPFQNIAEAGIEDRALTFKNRRECLSDQPTSMPDAGREETARFPIRFLELRIKNKRQHGKDSNKDDKFYRQRFEKT